MAQDGASHASARFSTRRRLVLAFSLVLAAFVSALALQLIGFRRMQATLAGMAEHEEQMGLALELEAAVREQYAHEERFVAGEMAHRGEYERARSRAADLMRLLRQRVDEPEAAAYITEIEQASAALDRMFRDQLAPAVLRRNASAVLTHEEGYPLVSLIENDVDLLFARLQQATSSFRTELVNLEETALGWTLLLLVTAPAFVAAAVIYLSRSIAKPLARLREGAAALASGDLDRRIAIDTPDEFGELAADFNTMTAALKQHQQRLVHSEKLAGIGRLAAGVAHEINNPLQVMLGYLTLHRDEADPRLSEHLAAVEHEAMRCKDIVDGLLELSRPMTAMTPVPVDLRRLCDEVAAALRVSSRSDGVGLSVDGAGVALGHRPKLRQVVHNLMKNAVEAAAPKGEVKVLVRPASDISGDVVEVAVADSGPGVTPEASARIFEPFFTTKPSGTGLGLAVSRAIARAHRGDIHVGGAGVNGALFTLRLPRASDGGK